MGSKESLHVSSDGFESRILHKPFGGLAHLVERFAGSEKVRGSTPLVSTNIVRLGAGVRFDSVTNLVLKGCATHRKVRILPLQCFSNMYLIL